MADTPWCGDGASGSRLYLQSGQFSATLKDSEDVSAIEDQMHGIDTNNFNGRMGIASAFIPKVMMF